MNDIDYDNALELMVLDEIGFLDDEEYWNYIILRGKFRIRIMVY